MKNVLLTSVCRPLGPRHGDAPAVGYELLLGQVTRAQGLFSPRSLHGQFGLEYIAENLEAPTTVLQYPSKREFIRELKKGYDIVGISFILATYHHLRRMVTLVREHAPNAKIVLGGYGTVLPDAMLLPWGDTICRDEGVGFMRELLGESELPMPHRHPLIINALRVFGIEAGRTGVVCAGLGCPNGCDFCCTSHFFKRTHIRLAPTGGDIHRLIERYLEVDPAMSMIIIDEDFLLHKKRALELREAVLAAGRPLSIFCFASIRALSRLKVEEILEMGIDGLWIGYEGTRAGYAKQEGRPADDLLRELRAHGITVLASMIVGLPYQTPEIIEEELSGLLALQPALTQFLIYGPTPGTPFWDQVQREGLLSPEMANDMERYCHEASGFRAMVKHPSMSAATIEALQAHCFKQDFERLGPSIYRCLETWLLGHLRLRASDSAYLRAKSELFGREIRKSYPIFLAGRLLGPNAAVRHGIRDLQKQVHAALGSPTIAERAMSLVAVVMALWTWFTLRAGLFQHPKLVRRTFRVDETRGVARAWRRVRRRAPEGSIEVEGRAGDTVWVRIAGSLANAGASAFARNLGRALRREPERVVIDLALLVEAERDALDRLAEELQPHRDRIRVIAPALAAAGGLAAAFPRYR